MKILNDRHVSINTAGKYFLRVQFFRFGGPNKRTGKNLQFLMNFTLSDFLHIVFVIELEIAMFTEIVVILAFGLTAVVSNSHDWVSMTTIALIPRV